MVALWVQSGRLLAGLGLVPLWLAGFSAVVWHLRRWPAIAYRHAFYRVDDLGIEIRRGVYFREVINVPRSRVQHTDVSQGPLERRFGLGTLVIHTAGTANSEVTLTGLEHALAGRIRDHLLPRDAAMLSEHRLHPASILFALVGSLKAFALPALLLFFSSLRSSPSTGAERRAGGRAGGSTAGSPGTSSWTTGRRGCCSCSFPRPSPPSSTS